MVFHLKEYVIFMTEAKGHFEQGRWIEDPVPAPVSTEIPIDGRICTAKTTVIAAMDDVANVTRDLVTSEEGKKYIEKTLKDTTVQVQRSFEEILIRTKSEIDSKIKSLNSGCKKSRKNRSLTDFNNSF